MSRDRYCPLCSDYVSENYYDEHRQKCAADTLEQLVDRVRELEHSVAVLEGREVS